MYHMIDTRPLSLTLADKRRLSWFTPKMNKIIYMLMAKLILLTSFDRLSYICEYETHGFRKIRQYYNISPPYDYLLYLKCVYETHRKPLMMKKYTSWNRDAMTVFLDDSNYYDIHILADKYNIKPSTAKGYISKFKKELEEGYNYDDY